MKAYKYLYGPVHSWRLGMSIGIDLLSQEQKQCSFDCDYCQVGPSVVTVSDRRIFVPTEEVLGELKEFPQGKADFLTFSGKGEPTLAKNIGEVIKGAGNIRKEKIAVITNSSMLYREDARKDIISADVVMCKLDAATVRTFAVVNRPAGGVTLESIVDGIAKFGEEYKGKLALQIMFVKENMNEAGAIASIAKKIAPDEVQLNTPLRYNARHKLSPDEMDRVKMFFTGFKVISVYDSPTEEDRPIDRSATAERRGNK